MVSKLQRGIQAPHHLTCRRQCIAAVSLVFFTVSSLTRRPVALSKGRLIPCRILHMQPSLLSHFFAPLYWLPLIDLSFGHTCSSAILHFIYPSHSPSRLSLSHSLLLAPVFSSFPSSTARSHPQRPSSADTSPEGCRAKMDRPVVTLAVRPTTLIQPNQVLLIF